MIQDILDIFYLRYFTIKSNINDTHIPSLHLQKIRKESYIEAAIKGKSIA